MTITLDRYLHVLPGLEEQAAAKLDELLSNAATIVPDLQACTSRVRGTVGCSRGTVRGSGDSQPLRTTLAYKGSGGTVDI